MCRVDNARRTPATFRVIMTTRPRVPFPGRGLALWGERLLQAGLRAGAGCWSRLRQAGRRLEARDFRGTRCHCPPDLPRHFLHSEGLREACDFVVDEGSNVRAPGRLSLPVRDLRRFAEGLGAGAAVHVKTDPLDEFVRHVLPVVTGPIVLVTGDSDSSQVRRHRALLDDPRIAHWFAQNCDLPGRHPRLTRVPIGLDNPVYTKLEKRLGFALTMALGRTPWDPTISHNDMGDQALLQQVRAALPPPAQRPRRVLCTFHQNQKLIAPDIRNLPARAAAAAALAVNPDCHFVSRRLPQDECWRRHEAFAFEASPPGNGLDCFRTWEALLLGTIPLVPSTTLDPLYVDEQYPVVIINSWAEVTPANLERWAEELQPRFTAGLEDRLALDYWVEKIKRASQAA